MSHWRYAWKEGKLVNNEDMNGCGIWELFFLFTAMERLIALGCLQGGSASLNSAGQFTFLRYCLILMSSAEAIQVGGL